jgi:hypothetical protein
LEDGNGHQQQGQRIHDHAAHGVDQADEEHKGQANNTDRPAYSS